jgi:hypothetical protein
MQDAPCRRALVCDVKIVDVSDIASAAVPKKIEETSIHGKLEGRAAGC